MKSLQEYIEIYRSIARNLNLQGDSVEVLSQMLANATYISEVEHISYSQEASLERASLMNSKIQHCMNDMYSVFRGSCPRVIIRFTSNSYFTWNLFDEIATSNNFSVYYLGYLNDSLDNKNLGELSNREGTSAISDHPEFIYSPVVIPPTGDSVEYTIIALISPKLYRKTWKLTKNNLYYVNFLESDLSNDIMVKVNGSYHNVTRVFSDHIKDSSIFDLTLPDFGLRLYSPNIFNKTSSNNITSTNTEIEAEVFKYSTLESYNQSELKQIKLKGAKLSSISTQWSNNYGYPTELCPGLILINEIPRDAINTIHYKSSKERYVGGIFRSNSDIGSVLEEMYPDKVRTGGTSYRFESIESLRKQINVRDNVYDLSEINKTISEGTGVLNLLSGLKIYGGEEKNIKKDLNFSPEFSPNSIFTCCIDLDKTGSFENSKPKHGVIEVPITGTGTLKFIHKSSYSHKTPFALYDILPQISTVTMRYLYTDYNKYNSFLVTQSINDISIIRSSQGVIDVLKINDLSKNGLSLYAMSDNNSSLEKQITLDYSLSDFIIKDSRAPEKISLILKRGSEVLDMEVLPVIYLPPISSDSEVDEKYKKNLSGDLVFNLSNDTIFLESNSSGEIISSFPIVVSSFVYSGGELITSSGVSYSILNSSGIECSISSDGKISITGIKSIQETYYIAVQAVYLGVSLVSTLILKTSISLEAFKKRELVVSSDPQGLNIIGRFNSPPEGILSKISYSSIKENDSLYLWASDVPGIEVYSIIWSNEEEVLINLLEKEDSVVPTLIIYYIPQLNSTLLTRKEVSDFISSRSSYYVTHDIDVKRGRQVSALVNLDIELFKNESVESEVRSILENYSYKFNINLENLKPEIESSISKLSNVKKIKSLNITYSPESFQYSNDWGWENIEGDLDKTYFVVTFQINSSIVL